MQNVPIIDHSAVKPPVLDIRFNSSKLLLSLIIILFGLLSNNNSIALQGLLDSRLLKNECFQDTEDLFKPNQNKI